jgi:tetrahydromethanopterin S-methyltransferase subunit A
MNALEDAGVELDPETVCCSNDHVEEHKGWPPLPGNYLVLRYRAPVAVCTLTDESLMNALAAETDRELALIGTLQTENLGIERLIINTVVNPNIRFLVICGPDSRQTVGHLPGQSLLQLSRSGINNEGRIIGAKGKRPFIKNISCEIVERYRKMIEVVDLIGTSDIHSIIGSVQTCIELYPGPAAESLNIESAVRPIVGYTPKRMTSDPMGYFIIYADRKRSLLSVEHYNTDGVVDAVIEGQKAVELYFPAIDRGLVTRLDHAAYLGRELERAERAMKTGEDYIQDAAPECATELPKNETCECRSSCVQNTQHS